MSPQELKEYWDILFAIGRKVEYDRISLNPTPPIPTVRDPYAEHRKRLEVSGIERVETLQEVLPRPCDCLYVEIQHEDFV
jgi:hypothetical protein